MVFCNIKQNIIDKTLENCHNPYFSRWFSAISYRKQQTSFIKRHNPYFSRWFSAIQDNGCFLGHIVCHNPYFSRWFSAIKNTWTKT